MNVFFNSHQITIRRLRVTNGYSSNYSATFTVYQADIQPSDTNRVSLNGAIGGLYEAFLDASVPIKEADQVTANGQTYSVQSVNYFRGANLLDHKHIIMVAKNADN
jgi:hypothetical protein